MSLAAPALLCSCLELFLTVACLSLLDLCLPGAVQTSNLSPRVAPSLQLLTSWPQSVADLIAQLAGGGRECWGGSVAPPRSGAGLRWPDAPVDPADHSSELFPGYCTACFVGLR